jgi:hypothetical protein
VIDKEHSVQTCALPEVALLQQYANGRHYTDCFCLDVGGRVSLEQYVFAFYTGGVFRLERLILRWIAGKPSTDAQAQEIAAGLSEEFAAWDLESRTDRQLLLRDFRGRTRSWFMVQDTNGQTTRLFFGSAVVAAADPAGKARPRFAYRALLPLHRVYSKVLLAGARRQLKRSKLVS